MWVQMCLSWDVNPWRAGTALSSAVGPPLCPELDTREVLHTQRSVDEQCIWFPTLSCSGVLNSSLMACSCGKEKGPRVGSLGAHCTYWTSYSCFRNLGGEGIDPPGVTQSHFLTGVSTVTHTPPDSTGAPRYSWQGQTGQPQTNGTCTGQRGHSQRWGFPGQGRDL